MPNFRSLGLVTKREIVQRIRTRSFLFSTVMLVVLALGAVAYSGLRSTSPARLTLGIVGQAHAGLDPALQAASNLAARNLSTYRYGDVDAGKAALQAGRVDGLLVDEKSLLFQTKDDATLVFIVEKALGDVTLADRAAAAGITIDQARALIAPPSIQVGTVNEAKSGNSTRDSGTPFIVGVILYVSITMYGGWTLVGVIEEKSSRVVEVLLSSVSPEELLAGKVLGIVSVAMVQMLAAITAGLVALIVIGGIEFPSIAPGTAVADALYFITGTLFYNFLYAAARSTVTRQSEASSAVTPLSLALLVPYFLSLSYVPNHPDAALSVVLSFVPFSAPLVMPARIAAGEPGVIEVAVSLLLMLPALVAVVWFATRIYTGAILHLGSRIGFGQAFRDAARS